MKNIQKYYIKKVEKLLYEEYLQFVLLLYISYEKLERCIRIEYYKIVNKKSTKFLNQLITICFKKIIFQLKAPLLLAN